MKYLVDTHIFLWYINGSRSLNKKTIEIIENIENEIFLSVISFWECIVKSNIGKLKIPEPVFQYVDNKRIDHQFGILDLVSDVLINLEKLPDIHKDPFDRLLICQALHHDLMLITDDQYILKYPVKILNNL